MIITHNYVCFSVCRFSAFVDQNVINLTKRRGTPVKFDGPRHFVNLLVKILQWTLYTSLKNDEMSLSNTVVDYGNRLVSDPWYLLHHCASLLFAVLMRRHSYQAKEMSLQWDYFNDNKVQTLFNIQMNWTKNDQMTDFCMSLLQAILQERPRSLKWSAKINMSRNAY